MVLKKDIRSFLTVCFLGVLFGGVCALLDYLPSKTLWAFCLSGSIGFWGISTAMILLKSENKFIAGINSFLYLSCANFTFFMVHYLLPMRMRGDTFGESLKQGIVWLIPSAVCGIFGMITFSAKRNDKLGCFIFSLPLGAVLYDTVSFSLHVLYFHRSLLQVILNLLGIILLWKFHIDKKSKGLTLVFTLAVAAVLLLITYLADGTILIY